MYRAIIIDDDQWAIADMKRCFSFEKHAFCLCGAYQSAEDALPAILADPPDLIISDIWNAPQNFFGFFVKYMSAFFQP